MITNNQNPITIKRRMSDSSLIKSRLNDTKCYSKDDLSLTTKKSSNVLSKEDTIKSLKHFQQK